MLKEIIHFLLHLRLHYQFFILSGGYLLGGVMATEVSQVPFWLQFLNVHILLFGGATAFNSFWDKDEGPIGGLKNPPKMTPWMRVASLGMMAAGWLWSALFGWIYFSVYGVSLLLFWLYSTPVARWKGHPHLSLVAIAVSTGFNSVLLGVIAAGSSIGLAEILAAAGASLILLSLYPVSQIFQTDEDQRRGDRTFAGVYGIKGVKTFFRGCYFSGLLVMVSGIYFDFPGLALFFFITGLISGAILTRYVQKLKGVQNEYGFVMKMKFFASLSFVLFLLALNLLRYEPIGSAVFRIQF
jgi:4-hydroxybenzoate polyprenyltransferase